MASVSFSLSGNETARMRFKLLQDRRRVSCPSLFKFLHLDFSQHKANVYRKSTTQICFGKHLQPEKEVNGQATEENKHASSLEGKRMANSSKLKVLF